MIAVPFWIRGGEFWLWTAEEEVELLVNEVVPTPVEVWLPLRELVPPPKIALDRLGREITKPATMRARTTVTTIGRTLGDPFCEAGTSGSSPEPR
jgi:hypothetical protein